MRSSVCASALGVLLALTGLVGPGTARSEELPPYAKRELRFYDDIPGDRGMAYFYGVWDNYRAGGPLTVTDKVIASYEQTYTPGELPYRVLFTGRNYVLFVYKSTSHDGEMWTDFGVFALLPREYSGGEEGLRFLYCGTAITASAEAFEWPREKLLEEFTTKWCGPHRDPETGNLLLEDRWNDAPYWREPPELTN